jgi:membrane-associated protease RseP (regulator of RpoE activity)
VVVRPDASEETDKIGAKIEGVTPGGPADKAGIKVGDIITTFNGTSLAGAKAEDEDESGPGRKLVELARKLDPGDSVRLEYRRGGDSKKATLVTEDLGSSFRVEVPGAPMIMPRMPAMPEMNFEFFESPWGDLRLVSLNPDLGEYFGTKEGVLVVKAPGDSSLPLKGGDVITSMIASMKTLVAGATPVVSVEEVVAEGPTASMTACFLHRLRPSLTIQTSHSFDSWSSLIEEGSRSLAAPRARYLAWPE